MAERKIVLIDAGHGGQEPGAIYNGRREKDDTLRLALAVGRILSQNGVDVRYTRTDDTYLTPLERAAMANRDEVDYFVSIHRNAMPIPGSASGIQSLVYENKGIPRMLAENINRNLVQAGFADLGIIERPGLVVLRRTRMPAVLVEAGFIDNEKDNEFFDQNFPAIAQAIADGILMTIRQQEETTPKYYQVQTGAFTQRDAAERELNRLTRQGFPAFLVFEDGLYKVRAGAFTDLDNAVRMEQKLRQYGYSTLLVHRAAVR